jgi:hypothetical protein
MQVARNMTRHTYKNSPSQPLDEAFSIICWHAGGLNSPKGLELKLNALRGILMFTLLLKPDYLLITSNSTRCV